ncbi:MAG: hypothetical protein CVU90_01065 [Firmicutes bacterium HGW-Firmicutes-15]|nr:MAG: hypothetical protein CVU90_01065 [Firmicutes bacterium HGW-Firmicutes-15]
MAKIERNQTIADWTEAYLEVLEVLYGPFNMHPELTIEEVCVKRNDWFSVDSHVDVTAHEIRDIVGWTEPYLLTFESLYGPLNVHPQLSVEEVNEEWLNYFMKDYGTKTVLKKVA